MHRTNLVPFLLFLTVTCISAHVWRKSNDNSGNFAVISKTLQTSIISCAAICTKNPLCFQYRVTRLNTNCVASEKRCPVECYLLQKNKKSEGMDPPQDSNVYSLGQCQGDPCKINPCQNSGKCMESEGRTDCELSGYTCNCAYNFGGRNCEVCNKNYTGPECNVDISGQHVTLLDGIYFYAPSGAPKGTDNETHLRPDCKESRQICKKRGMRLLTIKSPEKNATFAKLNLHSSGCRICFFRLGLHQFNATQPWFWDDQDQMNFNAWFIGAPDYELVFQNDTEAAVLPANVYGWSNVECKFPAYYVCEYDTKV